MEEVLFGLWFSDEAPWDGDEEGSSDAPSFPCIGGGGVIGEDDVSVFVPAVTGFVFQLPFPVAGFSCDEGAGVGLKSTDAVWCAIDVEVFSVCHV